MPVFLSRITPGLLLLLMMGGGATALTAAPVEAPGGTRGRSSQTAGNRRSAPVDFARDVFPLLKKHCFDCHGADEQEGQLRLDAKAVVFRGGKSGPAVVPKKPNESLLLQRVLGKGGGQRMPLDADPLSAAEISLLKRWIEEGADWPEGIGSKATSIRKHWAYIKPQRPSLPSVKNRRWVRNPIDTFILSRLEKEGLSPSPEADKERLIRRVTLDLTGLPPTPAEIDAFLKDDSPQAYEKVVDRLLASPRYGERWAVPWLDAARYADSNGYQRDGRRVYWAYRDWVIRALNADMPFDQFTIEQIAGDLLPGATTDQIIATGFHRGTMANVEAGTDPEEEHVLAVIDRVNTTGTVWLGTTIECGQCHSHKYDPFTQEEYYRLYAFFNNTEKEIRPVGSRRDFIGPKMELPLPPDQAQRRAEVQREMDRLAKQKQQLVRQLKPRQKEWEQKLVADQSAMKKLPRKMRQIISSSKRNARQQRELTEYFLSQNAGYRQVKARLAARQKEYDQLAPPTTLVMKELPQPRITRVFKRGDFLKPVGPPLKPGTPKVLHPLPPDTNPNRLTLAKWLVDENNPLTARVTVNRQWAEFFGRGIVTTLEDFGTQGERPTHPQLLDWLAVEFMHNGWSMKRLHRLIVTSATYRQSARVTPELLRRDKFNSLYARGPRGRLKAEFIRDNALAVSGLLSQKMYGPPVFPYQPPGVWHHIGVASNKWTTSKGDDLYRRGLYTYWRRTVPYPSFVNFDAPSREACTVKRSVSNTPLQALTLMNDPAYFEMAVTFAVHILEEKPAALSLEERLRRAFRRATSRRPTSREVEILLRRYRQELSRYQRHPQAAAQLLEGWKVPAGINRAQLAAWVHITNILLNLDETITR